MNPEIHQRAAHLIDAWHVEGISDPEREWLEAHLGECPACAARMRSSELALQALRRNSVTVDPALVATTQARVRWRARQLREDQARLRALGISCGLSWLLGAITAPLLWQAVAWLGRIFEVSRAVWITAFALGWIFPASVVGAIIAWRYSRPAAFENDQQPWER